MRHKNENNTLGKLYPAYTYWLAALIIVAVGFVVYCDSLHNPFQGDDMLQIVQSAPIHSLTHIRLLFQGGTFYNGQGLAPLNGTYYRPIAMTTYALVYGLFEPQPIYFHMLQLLLCCTNAFLLYTVLKRFVRPLPALVASLVFLVHPLDSQVVFAIPATQDAVFFFFGILGTWLLMRQKTLLGLLLVMVCFFLSILSKETGVLFSIMGLFYLWWFDRRRLLTFLGIMAMPALVYIALKLSAVGLNPSPHVAPIDSLSFLQRVMTAPSEMLLYASKFIFPWRLASSYYWVHPHFNIRFVLLPLLLDGVLVAIVIFTAKALRKRAKQEQFYAFCFFALWCGLGLLAHLNLIPLDMTACEIWFYYSMAGLLGMVAVALSVFHPRLPRAQIYLIVIVIVSMLGARTVWRGRDWQNSSTLAAHDIQASPDDYTAYVALSTVASQQHNTTDATTYALDAVHLFPTALTYDALGTADASRGDMAQAITAYMRGIRYQRSYLVYEHLAAAMVQYNNENEAKRQRFFQTATKLFPQDSTIQSYETISRWHSND